MRLMRVGRILICVYNTNKDSLLLLFLLLTGAGRVMWMNATVADTVQAV